MTVSKKLYLHEEIMLLALKDREGTVAAGSTYHFAIGGAILAELMLQKRLEVEKDGKKRFARVVNRTPVGNSLLDNCLTKLDAAKKRAQLSTWVSRFANTKNLKHLVAGRLAERGILRVDKDKVLGIFTRTIYPEVDPGPERALLARLEQAIFTESSNVAPRTAVLVSLANSADLLRYAFDRKQLKSRRTRIERICNGESTGKATREAIAAMQAAVMVACIMPAIMASSAATH
ncbi:MAG: GPP34 family phosphoprotein [Candidatus Krumholzibacteria bacterium]|jgi:hypothetical protein|nr:GPP34 family phosphoprotein [Candidatus Krumholzibacteria bacterium]